MSRLVFGRPSGAAEQPVPLRPDGAAEVAAYRADAGDTEAWRVRAATVAGVRHRLAGIPGEDAYAWRRVDDDVVVAVGDGVGTRAGSAGAARQAVAAACAAVVEALGEEPAGDAAERACRAAVAAANRSVEGSAGATTLVVLVARGDGRCTAARVGDSTAFLLSDGVWLEQFPVPEAEDVASTVTAALPDAEPGIEWARLRVGAGEAVVVVTDGVADPLRDGPTTVAPSLAGSLASPPSPLELAALVDFSRQGCHDDRTLVGLWRPGPD